MKMDVDGPPLDQLYAMGGLTFKEALTLNARRLTMDVVFQGADEMAELLWMAFEGYAELENATDD